MRRGKRSKVEFFSTGEGKRGVIYIPYHLAAASEAKEEFVKLKMTKKVVTWVLAYDGIRIVMKEDRKTGEIRSLILKDGGETLLRLGATPIVVHRLGHGLPALDHPGAGLVAQLAQLAP